MFTRSNQLPVFYLNDSIDIPMKLSGDKYEGMVINAVKSTVDGMNAVSGSTFATSMFVSYGLSEVWGHKKIDSDLHSVQRQCVIPSTSSRGRSNTA
jgi:hypothetical protein